jgi:hypothetical protein
MSDRFIMSGRSRHGQEGGTRLKFLIVVLVLGAVAYAGYLYVPVAYQAFYLKDLMQHDVDVAATQSYPVTWVTDQLRKAAAEYGMPPDAIITPGQEDNRIIVRVQFTTPIEFPGFTYQYEFDHTAKSTTFFTTK